MNGRHQNDLSSLDPEIREPGYWSLFQIRVLALAGPELERRRAALRQATLSGVVTSWSKAVVPLATAAAAAAVLVIMGGSDAASGVMEPQPVAPALEVAGDGGPSSPFEDERQLPVILTASVEGF